MKKYDGYLIDLDGTMYKGKEKIVEACHFVQALHDKGIPYLFVTNNSTKTPEQVVTYLREFEIPAEVHQVFTTSQATASFISERKSEASVYIIGEAGLRHAMIEKGITIKEEGPDFVVVGLDRSINYEKLAIACLAVRAGATFISTNGDIALPTERGFLPGNGSITSVVTVSTEVNPIFIGKPEKVIMEQALKAIGTDPEKTLMIGDNYHTDILAGIQAGLDTLLVHTGVTTTEHLLKEKIQPTYVIHSLEEWLKNI